MKTATIIALITAFSGGFSQGQDAGNSAAPASPEMAAVAANDRAYETAFAKADIKALADFYTEDVSYTAEDGNVIEGRAAVEAAFRESFSANKGAKLSIKLDSVKVLAPEVVVQKGSSTVFSKKDEPATAMFTAVHVKKDDKWRISQLIETPMPEISPSERLAGLAWLIGDWEEADKETGVTIHSHYQWARGGNFISRNVTVKRGDDPVLEGWQIIGWDPVEEAVRSWTFDDQGGQSGGLWTSEGQRWLARETGYTADGSRTSADQTITKVSDDRFYWESGNRTLDGNPQPGIGRIEIRRVKGE